MHVIVDVVQLNWTVFIVKVQSDESFCLQVQALLGKRPQDYHLWQVKKFERKIHKVEYKVEKKQTAGW